MVCEGSSDDCTGEATTTRDTSQGFLKPTPFCDVCAMAYDCWVDNYEPPEPDGEAFRGGEAAAYAAEQAHQAWRLK